MSNFRSKNSNKKFDNKKIFKTIKRDYSTNLPLEKQKDTIDSINTPITIENDDIWSLLNNQKQTSTSKQLKKFFCFGSSMTEKKEHQTFEPSIGWDQILDREFQSLDIDADGYVSIADLQSVLK
jgi:Ca2+-binding EF-hand superfamily protein